MKHNNFYLKIVFLLSYVVANVVFLNAQIRKTPIMGWASWNNFETYISESIIKRQADSLVSKGLVDLGYRYVNIDDGFLGGRDEKGGLIADTRKFPKGMRELSDYIRSKGLIPGIYSDAGRYTCGSIWQSNDVNPGGLITGLYGNDRRDIDSLIVTWNYDFLKVDFCGGYWKNQHVKDPFVRLDEYVRYSEIACAIKNSAKPNIVYNICRWSFPGTWATEIASSWRISGDIKNNIKSIFHIVDLNSYLSAYCSPGRYNDMDMLQLGRGMTEEQDRTHFSMWCIMSSPLLLGNDMMNLDNKTLSIISNPEVIAVNQDSSGLQAQLIYNDNKKYQVWAKPLDGRNSGVRAVALLNRTDKPAIQKIKFADIQLVGKVHVRDLWERVDKGVFEGEYSVEVPAYGTKLLKIKSKKTVLKETFEAETAWLNKFNRIGVGNYARYTEKTILSGGAQVSNLGADSCNWMEFRDVYARKAGLYRLQLYFVSGESRNLDIRVSGVNYELFNLKSADWNTVDSVTLDVYLKRGQNVIRLSNPNGLAPDIDKIQINTNKRRMILR